MSPYAAGGLHKAHIADMESRGHCSLLLEASCFLLLPPPLLPFAFAPRPFSIHCFHLHKSLCVPLLSGHAQAAMAHGCDRVFQGLRRILARHHERWCLTFLW